MRRNVGTGTGRCVENCQRCESGWRNSGLKTFNRFKGKLAVLALTLLAMFANCMLFSVVWNWINYESRWSGGVQLALQLILIGTPVLNTVVLWLYLYQRDRERRLRLSVAKSDHESVTDG